MKKINKLLSFGMSVVTACSLGVGLIACGGDDDNSNINSGNTDVLVPDFNDIVSEQVADEAAWKAAFDFSSVSNATYTVDVYADNNGAVQNVKIVYKFDGNKIYVKYTMGAQFQEMYYKIGNEDVMYSYDGAQSKWTNTVVSNAPNLITAMSSDTIMGGGNIIAIGENYAQYIFDSEKNAYVFSDHNDDQTVVVKINGEKFCGVDINMRNFAPEAELSVKISNRLFAIGTTVVELPKM